MSDHDHAPSIPRWVLLGTLALILATVALAAISRARGPVAPPAPVVESVTLSFEDRSDGALAVHDGATGREVSVLSPATNGFVRGVLRGMNRSRKLESLSRQEPFVLARHADGTMTLRDATTGRVIALDAFGVTNVGAFASLLDAGRRASR